VGAEDSGHVKRVLQLVISGVNMKYKLITLFQVTAIIIGLLSTSVYWHDKGFKQGWDKGMQDAYAKWAADAPKASINGGRIKLGPGTVIALGAGNKLAVDGLVIEGIKDPLIQLSPSIADNARLLEFGNKTDGYPAIGHLPYTNTVSDMMSDVWNNGPVPTQ
jgi:hypothetical protein